MAVVELHIFPGDAPNAESPLVTLTDADVESFEMRVGENELGAGKFTIRRDHIWATAANLAAGNYVQVWFPVITDGPLFGFWLDELDDTILATDEEGGETLTRGGPGTLAILGRAMLLDDFYNGPLGGTERGNYSVPGYWTWSIEPYGAILVRVIEEGQFEPGEPLQHVNIDWTRTVDSLGNAWPDINQLIQFPIGTDGLTAYATLVSGGQLYVRADPDLSLHAYKNRGADHTGTTYDFGKVRFVKGENVFTEVTREGHGTRRATHVLVEGMDLNYRQIVDPAYVSGPGRWSKVDFQDTNDSDLLDAVGGQEIIRRNADIEALELEFRAGDDEEAGRYFPWVHFQTGDLVTVHTGVGAEDYNNADARVTGWRIVLSDTSEDEHAETAVADELAAASLRWVVELNGGQRSGALGRPDIGAGGDCSCPCSLGSAVPDSDPVAYAGEMYFSPVSLGTATGSDQVWDWPSPTLSLGYVPGTLVVFIGSHMVIPTVQVPESGTFRTESSGSGEVRAYARVACEYEVTGG